jgi:hypothetical protein
MASGNSSTRMPRNRVCLAIGEPVRILHIYTLAPVFVPFVLRLNYNLPRGHMLRRFGLVALLSILSLGVSRAITSLNVPVITKSIVFFYASDSAGHVIDDQLVATGFLVLVPNKNGENTYPLLVTARHVVDPSWAGCQVSNPTKLYIRVNKMRFDPTRDSTGVSYLPVDLTTNSGTT